MPAHKTLSMLVLCKFYVSHKTSHFYKLFLIFISNYNKKYINIFDKMGSCLHFKLRKSIMRHFHFYLIRAVPGMRCNAIKKTEYVLMIITNYFYYYHLYIYR